MLTEDKYRTYEKLTSRKLLRNEAPDVYLADIRQMLEVIDDTISVHMLKCCLLAGLPDELKMQIKSSSNLDQLSVEGLMEKIRSLVNDVREANNVQGIFVGRRDVTCYQCGRRGHVKSQCISLYSENQLSNSFGKRLDSNKGNLEIRCYNCNQVGHYKNQCKKQPKNANESL